MTSIAIMMAAMTTALCGCTDKTVMQTDGDGNATSANDSFRIDMTRAVPGQYLSETTQQGQVVRIEYESKDYTRDDRPATRKPAYVYLPYGYDESRQYNVVYLMHGWTGTAEDTFGALGGAQKNILDWMIQQGDCQPVIVVSPTWDKDNQAKGWGESCEEIAVFHNEYENDLIPVVESRFATFAETTDRAGIVASRNHRAFGGFSLGSVTTWYVFEHCFDLQRFFLPMSGDSWHVATFGGQTAPEQTARFLATVVRSSPFGTDNGFHVWHAVGTRDARFYQTHNQAMACMQLTDVFTPHNFSYHQREGGLHDYNSVVEFVYNALPFFFPAETGQAFTSTSRISDVMDDPAFGDWGRLVFPVDDGYWSGETLGQLRMAWYNYIDPDKTVEICNYLKSHADSVFIDIYTEAEKQADPQKRNTRLFFFRGNHGAPFAVCNAGGAFAYVGAMHDSFPHALELSKLGYNAFALILPPRPCLRRPCTSHHLYPRQCRRTWSEGLGLFALGRFGGGTHGGYTRQRRRPAPTDGTQRHTASIGRGHAVYGVWLSKPARRPHIRLCRHQRRHSPVAHHAKQAATACRARHSDRIPCLRGASSRLRTGRRYGGRRMAGRRRRLLGSTNKQLM